MKNPATPSGAALEASLSPARRRLAILMGQVGVLTPQAAQSAIGETIQPQAARSAVGALKPPQHEDGQAVEHQPESEHGSGRAGGEQQVSRNPVHAGTFEEKAAPSGRKTGSDGAAVGAGGTAPGETE